MNITCHKDKYLIQTNHNTYYTITEETSLANKLNVLEVFRAHVILFQFTSHCFSGFCRGRTALSYIPTYSALTSDSASSIDI